jgi:hypothetical protein
MLYEAKLSPSEVGLLAGLIGEQILGTVGQQYWRV